MFSFLRLCLLFLSSLLFLLFHLSALVFPLKYSASVCYRWRVAVAAGGLGRDNVSYVNSIWTPRGGTHQKYIIDQIVEAVRVYIRRNHKDLDVSERQVRAHVWVCVAALVENPTFDSQVTAPWPKVQPYSAPPCMRIHLWNPAEQGSADDQRRELWLQVCAASTRRAQNSCQDWPGRTRGASCRGENGPRPR